MKTKRRFVWPGRSSALVAAMLLLVSAMSCRAYNALQRPTELQFWDPAKAQNGYTFFGVGGTTYLIDMEGRVVHTWPVGNNPHLLDNGNVLDAATNDPSGFGGFKEVDWSGRTVWQYTDKRTTYHPHHDFTRIYNARLGAYTTLYIANRDFTAAECIAAGANPAQVPVTGAQMDAIVEVDLSGNVVWEWCFFDHLVQDFDASKPNYVGAGKTIASYPGRLNINLTGHPLKGDWLHCNSLDYNPKLDQIVVNSVQGEFYVIDHGGTFVTGNPTSSAAGSAGDFLYRFGDPARYAQGSSPAVLTDWTQSTTGNKQLGGAHGVQWIGSGLAGEGHFLIFNNGQYLSEHTAQSYVMEINPFLNADGTDTGHYVNPPAAGYTTITFPAVSDKTPRLLSRQVVWNYYTKSNLTLFSHIGCSAQRLPNGNTLICADTYGYIMEVTESGEVVWDYIEPVTKSGAVRVIGDSLPMVNSIFRAYRFTASHPALLGRSLTPGGTITGRTTVENPYAGSTTYQALQRPTGLQYLDSSRAYSGYTLFAAGGVSWLIDLEGHVVQTWALGTNPRLLENGHLLDAATGPTGASGFRELDWEGNVVWEHYETRASYRPHGDFVRIFDPKLKAAATLYLASKTLTHAECIAAGCNPANGPFDGAQTDVVVEVDQAGNVVWEWAFFDHGVQDIDANKANYVGSGKTIASHSGRLNLNLPGRPVQSSWPNANALDYNQVLDQIVINSEQGEFYVVSHGATMVVGDPVASIALAASVAGDFLYRFGDPARYGQGSAPSVGANWENATSGNKQVGASNNVQWIATGLPGAGHFLVFNNNQYLFQRTPQSYAFEINPNLDSGGTDTGNYVNPPAAGYATWTFDKDTHKSNQLLSKQVVWKYGSVGNLALFSHFGSSVQRLPNGNTLLCATTQGYLVEVTAAGDVVWEFINPVTTAGIVNAIGDTLPMTNAVPRARRYGADFPGLLGQDLSPGGLITTYVANPATVSPARLVNISARAAVGGVSGAPILGFVVAGTESRSMLIRAVGPGLAAFGVIGALADPQFRLVQDGANVVTNDNWLSTDAAAMSAVGAFALAAGSRDAALVVNLPPGIYSAPVAATDGGSGVALLEVYDAPTPTGSTVVNTSARAYVGTGENVLIAGFVIAGDTAKAMLIRGIGPSLSSFGVTDALADPSVALYRSGTVLAANDNWSDATNAAMLSATAATVGAFALPSGGRDAALFVTLEPGVYSAVVSGVSGSTGTALVELYVVP